MLTQIQAGLLILQELQHILKLQLEDSVLTRMTFSMVPTRPYVSVALN